MALQLGVNGQRRTRTTRTPARVRRATRPSVRTIVIESEKLAVVKVRRPRGQALVRVARIVGGWIVFVIGVIFVILPVIPGTPLVILSAFMLAPDVPAFARVLDWSKGRFSHIVTRLTNVNERFAEDFHRRFSS